MVRQVRLAKLLPALANPRNNGLREAELYGNYLGIPLEVVCQVMFRDFSSDNGTLTLSNLLLEWQIRELVRKR